MNITETLIQSPESCQHLKELGFDGECMFIFFQDVMAFSDPVFNHQDIDDPERGNEFVTIPTYEQVFEWADDEHKIDAEIKIGKDFFEYNVFLRTDKTAIFLGVFKNRREAKEEAVKAIIKHIKENG